MFSGIATKKRKISMRLELLRASVELLSIPLLQYSYAAIMAVAFRHSLYMRTHICRY
jgi:hypothetical protein